MKQIILIVQRLIVNDVWFIAVPRICLLLLWGVFILLKPAAALKFSAWITMPAGIAAALLLSNKLTKFKWLTIMIPMVLLLLLLLLPRYDIPGVLAIIFVAAAIIIKSWKMKNWLSRSVSIFAFIFSILLILKMFSGDWFDFYTASAIALFGAAGWESGNIKRCQ